MDTYVTLLFNDNKDIKLFTSSFLYKNSTFLQAFDLDEDNVINILCPSSYIIDNDTCLFDDETDLSFMFTLKPYKFINVCRFLDIICYNNINIHNKINGFSEQFITYVMCNIYVQKHINEIHYFMQWEIRSIMNYLKNNINNLSHGDEIMCCTPEFYFLYLNEYREEVIKYNRRDIYELSLVKHFYYKYIHIYDNQLTYFIKHSDINDEQIIIMNKIEKYGIDEIGNDLLLHCLYNRKIDINYSYLIEYSNLSHRNCIDKNALMTIIEFDCHYSTIQYLQQINDNSLNDWNITKEILLSSYDDLYKSGIGVVCCKNHPANFISPNQVTNIMLHPCNLCKRKNEKIRNISPLLKIILSFNPPPLTDRDIYELCTCLYFEKHRHSCGLIDCESGNDSDDCGGYCDSSGCLVEFKDNHSNYFNYL